MKEEKFPNTRKPSHRQVCGELWNLRGQHTHTNYVPKRNSQGRGSPDGSVHHQQVGAEQGGMGSTA